VLFFVVCLSFHIHAQDTAWKKKTDSLKLALANPGSDANKISILLQLCKMLPADQYEQAVEHAEHAVALAVSKFGTDEGMRVSLEFAYSP
jgi:hypothetical protein